MWVVHWGFLLRMPWRTWVCPCEGQVWRWCTCLGCRDFSHTTYSGEISGLDSRKYSALEGHGNQYWPICSSILAWRNPSLTENPGRPQSTGSQRVRHDQSDPAHTDTGLFLPVAALPQGQLNVKAVQLLGLWGPWWRQVSRDTDCLCCRSYGPIRVFFEPLVDGDQKVSLSSLSP